MKNKEAIHALRHLYRNCSWNEITCEEYGCESCEDALSMAIEALQDTRGKANHVVAEIKVDTDEIMERLEQEWYKPNEWIPCSERLPERNGVYIVTRTISDGFEYGNITDACYFDGSDIWHDDTRVNHERKYLADVIAWMPLPEPYTKDGDSE